MCNLKFEHHQHVISIYIYMYCNLRVIVLLLSLLLFLFIMDRILESEECLFDDYLLQVIDARYIISFQWIYRCCVCLPETFRQSREKIA